MNVDNIEYDLYTEDVKRLMHEFKTRLPADFSLRTREEGPFIFIQVPLIDFNRRTVENRLDIAIALENLKHAIRKTGVNCEIETTEN